jgi:hypothetical protein
LFLTRYLRERAAERGDVVKIGNKEPADLTVSSPDQIVVRDDSGARTGWPTFDRSAGVSVLAGTRLNDFSANELAREVFADLTDEAILTWPGSPIASIEWDGCNGPYAVPEQADKARRYMTVAYSVIGDW